MQILYQCQILFINLQIKRLGKKFFYKMKKNTLIYGGGAIGSFLAACLNRANHKVYFLCRGKIYNYIKFKGLKINVYNNSTLKKKIFLKDSQNFIIINSLNKIKIKRVIE